MIAVTTALIAGIGIGLLLRKKEYLLKYIDIISVVFMFVLLTVLGLSLGINRDVIKSFKTVGIYALTISSFSIIGSSFLGLVIYKYIFKKGRDKN